MKAEYDFSHGKRGAVVPMPPGKERITIRLDTDILEWFRKMANAQGGGNYQTMINQVLREYIGGQHVQVEELVRRAIREELAQYKIGEPAHRTGDQPVKLHTYRKDVSEKSVRHKVPRSSRSHHQLVRNRGTAKIK